MRESRPRPRTLETVAGRAATATLRQPDRIRPRPDRPGGDTGEAEPRRAAEEETLAAGKRAAALAGRSARGTVRRLGRREAKVAAEAREERSRARAAGRRGPRTPTEAGRGAGTAGARGDGRQEAPAPPGAPRLARVFCFNWI